MHSQRLPLIVGEEIFFDIFGADPGDDNTDDDSVDDELDEDLDENEDDDSEDEDDSEGDSVESLRAELEAERKLRERAEHRMRAADRAKTAAEAKLKSTPAGGGDAQKDLDAAKAEIENLKAELAKASGTDTATLIREEFRDFAGVQWHNPRVAFSMLDLNAIEVNDGKVDEASLKYAIEDLMKDHAYLVASGDKKTDEKSVKKENENPNPNPTGINPRRRKKTTDRAALQKKYPSLRSRG